MMTSLTPNRCGLLACLLMTATLGNRLAAQTLETSATPQSSHPSEATSSTGPTKAIDPVNQLPPEQAQALRQLIIYLVRENLPRTHVDNDDWGKTKRVYAGFKVTRDDWRLSTKRKWKEVEHGRWRQITIRLVDPDTLEHLTVGAEVVSWDPDTGQLQARLTIDATTSLFARQIRYNHGLKLLSLHAQATARIRFSTAVTVTSQLDYQQLPPAVVIMPHIDQASLEVADFHLDRLSQLRGDPAEWLGEAIEQWLQKKWVPRQNEQLADRMNAQLAKRQDTLRFSLNDWLQRWIPNSPPARKSEERTAKEQPPTVTKPK